MRFSDGTTPTCVRVVSDGSDAAAVARLLPWCLLLAATGLRSHLVMRGIPVAPVSRNLLTKELPLIWFAVFLASVGSCRYSRGLPTLTGKLRPSSNTRAIFVNTAPLSLSSSG